MVKNCYCLTTHVTTVLQRTLGEGGGGGAVLTVVIDSLVAARLRENYGDCMQMKGGAIEVNLLEDQSLLEAFFFFFFFFFFAHCSS
jgi:hypothetical protein